MIRVLLLAMIALGALALVARHLPASLKPQPAAHAASFERWEGTWEGTLVSYGQDGAELESSEVRLENDGISSGEQAVVMTRRRPDGRTVMTSGRRTRAGDTLEYRVTNPDGTLRVMSGHQAGD